MKHKERYKLFLEVEEKVVEIRAYVNEATKYFPRNK
jgi:hypothetical protein